MTTQAEREEIATLKVEVRELRADVAELRADVRQLTAALNQGRGMIAVISFFVGSSFLAAVGAVAGWFK